MFEQKNYSFTVLGNPKALKRHRMFRRGKHMGSYDPSKGDKDCFADIVQSNAPPTPIDEPIKLTLWFFFERPKNHCRTGRYSDQLKPNAPEWHISRPDVDNLIKFVADSLNGIFWRDDTLICHVEAFKRYSERPRTEVIIKILE